jgi:hypothetical protein
MFAMQQGSAQSLPTHFLGTTPQEEAPVPLRLLLLSVFPIGKETVVDEVVVDGEIKLESMTQLLEASQSGIGLYLSRPLFLYGSPCLKKVRRGSCFRCWRVSFGKRISV